MPTTLVIGASTNPERYAYKAVERLSAKGHDVLPLGLKSGKIGTVEILTQAPQTPVDTVTLYLSPALQTDYFEYILSLHPRRIIFNPGTENPDFYAYIRQHAPETEVEIACTLVLLSTGAY